jgi:hypothetical protein
MCQRKFVEKIKIHNLYSMTFFNCAVYEIQWINNVEQDGSQITIWRMWIACLKLALLSLRICNIFWLFQCNYGCPNAAQHYFISTLPVLLHTLIRKSSILQRVQPKTLKVKNNLRPFDFSHLSLFYILIWFFALARCIWSIWEMLRGQNKIGVRKRVRYAFCSYIYITCVSYRNTIKCFIIVTFKSQVTMIISVKDLQETRR